MRRFTQETAELLSSHLPFSSESIQSWLELPPDSTLGDVALPCFRLARDLKKAPGVIASELADILRDNPLFESVEAVGPYLNFRLHRDRASQAVFQDMREDNDFFSSQRLVGSRVAIDLSSPNIAKPFSMGHLRSTVIGTAIANLLEAEGCQVLRINHLGDWGTQFGKIIVAYRKYGDAETVKTNPIQELNALYVRFHEEAIQDPSLDDEARAAFKSMEDGDVETLALWRWMIDVSMEEFARTYKLLHTTFTHSLGESFYNDKMEAVVNELTENGLLQTSEGAEVVMLEALDLPPCLIKRSDGATLYATRDLAAALYRYRELGADRLIYVVGGEQRLHFQQVFSVLKLMGYSFADQCTHVAFGMMRLDGKKMSTRKGQVVRLQEVLEEAVARAQAIIAEKNPELAQAQEVASSIGVGAIVFNDLKTHRLHDIDFSLETALTFEGETGPYVQYTHARTCAVLRKAKQVETGSSPSGFVTETAPFFGVKMDDLSWDLVKQLSLFPEVRARAVDEYDPSLIAKQVLDLCQAFNHFYHDCPILSAEEPVRQFRLALTDAVRLVIRRSLELLGIAYPAEI